MVDVTEAERTPPQERAAEIDRPQRPERSSRADRRRAGRPAVSLGRVDGLDGLRVLGALAVVVYHVVGSVHSANPPAMVILPPFAFAFFLISGFVIYRPYAAAHLTRRRPPPIGRFIVSRAIRVLPLWWLAVGTYLLIRGNPLEGTWDWIATLALLQYVETDVRYAVIGPAWALSVEWIFYLSVPFVASGLWWANRRLAPRVAPVRVQAMALGALALPAAVIPSGRPFVAIVLGMALAVADVHRRIVGVTPSWLLLLRRPSTAVVTTVVAWGLLIVYPYREGLSVQWVEQDPLVVAIWIAVALTWFAPVAFRAPSGPITRTLAAPAMVRFSLLTFGIYLWHDLVLQETIDRLGTDAHLLAALYLTMLGALALAAFTFATVERPLMVFKAALDRRSAPTAPAEVLAAPDEAPLATVEIAPEVRPSATATADAAPTDGLDAPSEPEAPSPDATSTLPDPTIAPAGPTPGRGWITSIDGLRVVAAACVIGFHVGAEEQIPAAWSQALAALFIPVWSVFFVVSGYVLYRPWAVAQARASLGDGVRPTRAPDGGAVNFWLRRVLRVYPVYWVVQACALAISGTGDLEGATDWFQVITLFPLPDFNVIVNHGLGVIVWTMVVELVYYAVLPPLARGISALVHRGTSMVAANGVVLGLLFVALAVAGSTNARVLGVAVCIVVGMGIAVLDAWQRSTRRWAPGIRTLARRPIIALPVTLVWWAVGTWVARDDDPDLLFRTYLGVHLAAMVVVSFVLFIPAVLGPSAGRYRRALSSAPMRVLGPLTFGIYLWHYPVIRQTGSRIDLSLPVLLLWTCVAAVAMATLTYRLVEQPVERLRHRHLGRTSAVPPPPDAAPAATATATATAERSTA